MHAFSMPEWGQIFIPDQSLVESFLRGSLIYLSIVVLFRVVMKRQGGSIGLPDVLLVVLVSECVSNALSAEAKSVPNGLVAVSALLFWTYVLDRLGHRWPWFQRLLEPKPLQLVRDGVPIRENMDSEGITDEELEAQLREHGIDDLARVKAAFIESEGSVSVIPKEGAKESAATTEDADDSRKLDGAVERFLVAAKELRAAVAWQESRAADHRVAAKTARDLLAKRGAERKPPATESRD